LMYYALLTRRLVDTKHVYLLNETKQVTPIISCKHLSELAKGRRKGLFRRIAGRYLMFMLHISYSPECQKLSAVLI
jgi:hypothetical protein